MDRRKAIAERIKTMRMSRGMSQADLAAALHCAQSTVAMYETGDRLPGLDAVDYLADIFNVPPYAIYYSEKEIYDKIKMADVAAEITTDEMRLLRAYRSAIPVIRDAAMQMLEANPAGGTR